jgi:predicted nucleotidyltransferase
MSKLHPNVFNIIAVAKALKPLNQDVVFVGGATTLLYADNPDLGEARATEDVDCVVELATINEYQLLEEKLRSIGFKNSNEANAPICRWKLGKLIVDMMPTKGSILGFTNVWYIPGFEKRRKITIPGSDIEVYVFKPEYFLASKLEALFDRGINDLILSQDFEDIIFLAARRLLLSEELTASEPTAYKFIKEKLLELLKHDQFDQALSGQFPRAEQAAVRKNITDFFKQT